MAIYLSRNPLDVMRITSQFGPREAPKSGATTYHKGIDLGAKKPGVQGDNIYASANGTVKMAKFNTAMGYYAVIEYSNQFCAIYEHTKALELTIGETVKLGQVILHMGSTGISTAAHLHFGLKNCTYASFWNDDVPYVNPELYIREGELKMTFEQALAKLLAAKIITSVDYWKMCASTTLYIKELVINAATALEKK